MYILNLSPTREGLERDGFLRSGIGMKFRAGGVETGREPGRRA
jgi:hypothetical protein